MFEANVKTKLQTLRRMVVECPRLPFEMAYQSDGSVSIVVEKPIQCVCGKLSTMFVNRDGSTMCQDCDKKRVAARNGQTEA